MRPRSRFASVVMGCAIAATVMTACGETRRPIGEECLRDEDCLSGVCGARLCVSAPTLVTGAGDPPPDEEPRIPDDAGASSAPADALAEGG